MYKSFKSKEEAERFLVDDTESFKSKEDTGFLVDHTESFRSKEGAGFLVDHTEESDHEGDVVFTDGSSLGNGTSTARAGVGVYWGEGDPR